MLCGNSRYAIADHAITVPAQCLVLLQQIVLDHVNQRIDLLVDLVARADLVNLLHRALADQHVVAFVIDHHRHAFALKIERNLVHLAATPLHVQIGVREDGAIEQVAQAGLVVAVHVGVAQDVVAIAVRHIDVPFPASIRSCVSVPVLSVQRMSIAPRFWIELSRLTMTFFFDIAMAPLERFTVTIIGSISGVSPTATERREEQRLRPVVLGDADDEERRRDHDDHEADHQPGETRDASVETRLGPLAGQLLRNRTEIGPAAGVDHQGARRAADDVAPLETGVRQFDEAPARCPPPRHFSPPAWIRR